jgi:hypothetical protein
MPRTCGTKIGYDRVCGGSGEVTPRFYPAHRSNSMGGEDYIPGSDAAFDIWLRNLCQYVNTKCYPPGRAAIVPRSLNQSGLPVGQH